MNLTMLLMAFGAGAAIAAQAVVNGRLAAGLAGNTLSAALVSVCSGTLTLALVSLARGGLPASVALLPNQSPWTFAGGVLGAGFLFSTAFLAPRMGLTNMLVLIIAGQLMMSVTIDHFGLLQSLVRPVSLIRLLGVVVVLVGVMLTLLGERLVAALR
ncbi:MAG: DMT family transporter [Pseudomonadota bacterium]|nr:DMT family transporter [Pseudomonadota bacterium]